MKLTKKMIETANLSNAHFAKLASVSPATLKHYFEKKNQKEETVAKIELAAKVLKESELVWPDITNWPPEIYRKGYLKNKKKSDSLDKKFATALKKAAKASK